MNTKKGIINSFDSNYIENCFNHFGFTLKLNDDKEKYFFCMNDKSALEWSKIITKAFTHDLIVKIEYTVDNQITKIELVE